MNTGFKDYPSLLEQIRKRPQMWHCGTERSATLLAAFISGIQVTEGFHRLSIENCLGGFDWESFEEWVREKLNPSRLSHNSFSLAVHLSSSEPEAFDLWFSWYDEFGQANKWL